MRPNRNDAASYLPDPECTACAGSVPVAPTHGTRQAGTGAQNVHAQRPIIEYRSQGDGW